jgi:hypothetical protein
MIMRKQAPTVLFVTALASQLGATDCGQIIEDPGFDHWCGDELCYWKTERGEIRRVPTWRAGDDGVELVGDDVAISQMTAVTSFDTDCIRFEFLADVAETAEVSLEADVFGDGTIDWVERVPTSRWDKISFLIGIDGGYQGVLFRLTKVGDGRAVLAQIGAEEAEDCPSAVDVVSRPLGAGCLEPADCDSGICNGYVCAACDAGAPCDAGDVCGRAADAPGHLDDWRTCIPQASRALGELCFGDAECASGACNGLVCSECNDVVPCAGGAACGPAAETVPVHVCAPGAGGRPGGASCVLDGDCASGACDGAPLGSCDELGWSVCYEDDDCPVEGDLSPGVCTFQAVAGGTCQ